MTTGDDTPSNKPLIIKRYASRRLYNTESSDYVTLQDIAELIRSGRNVQVVDLKTGDDLTRQYLIQIIAEHEARGEQILPVDVLTEIVRSYSDHATIIPEFLRASFEAFQQNQQFMLEGLKQFGTPVVSVKDVHDRQKEFFERLIGSWGIGETQTSEKTSDSASDTVRNEDELLDIKRQLAELQSKVANL
ncbi:MAG: polyhydroxyalkanoate synthesis repressor PhaR [Albidovulum sp.]|nr:polyhydroxyalkanoate synthesis repressor PhaR [Albidovulum sp.]